MKQFSWKPLIPHFIAIGVFLIVALIYCSPALEGKVLKQHDITQWQAMAKDIHDYTDQHGTRPLWTKSMFSGMPGYMISANANNVVPYYVQEVFSLFLPKPFKFFFLACICFYIFCLTLRVNPYVAMVGALGYAYATYNPVIIGAGHDTKMISIALLPGFIAGLVLIYERRYWLGAGLTALFCGALISANHLQITYYGLIIAFIMTVAYVVRWIMSKQLKHAAIAIAFAAVSGLVGVLSNAVILFTTYEYSKETIRGGSQLADGKGNVGKSGLNEEYAFSYSMAQAEPMVMMFPRIFGGSSSYPSILTGNQEQGYREMKDEDSKLVQELPAIGSRLQSLPPQIGQRIFNFATPYWGGIGGTSGPPYVGAIMCFLALLGFAVLNNKHKWWALAAIIITVMMSWGEYFLGFNNFLLQHLPFYNKFRAPSMIIVVPTFLICMLAVMTLDKVLFRSADRNTLLKQFKQGLIITASVFAVALLMYISFDYLSKEETAFLKTVNKEEFQGKDAVKTFFSLLKEDRQGLFLADILRSLFFVGVAVLAIWLLIKKTIKPLAALALIGVFALIDVMVIDVKYLNGSNYQEPEDYEGNFTASREDAEILKDKSYYRVFDLRQGGVGGAFNQGAMTAYYHKSIGGYHPAKLSIYQDLIEKQLYNFPNCMPVINMLNTKYFIGVDERGGGYSINPDALGAAWLVKTIKWVNSPKEEMDALTTFNPKDTVVIDRKFESIANKPFTFDSSATITLVKADNDAMLYQTKSSSPQLAVFSEVYYNKGWKVFIDDKEAEYVKANYVLRAMPVPAGEHKIEFRFEPNSHKIGSMITLICSALMLILLGMGLWKWYKNKETLVIED